MDEIWDLCNTILAAINFKLTVPSNKFIKNKFELNFVLTKKMNHTTPQMPKK
jgi:hypothetical protein